eukprot:gene15568-biopygen250
MEASSNRAALQGPVRASSLKANAGQERRAQRRPGRVPCRGSDRAGPGMTPESALDWRRALLKRCEDDRLWSGRAPKRPAPGADPWKSKTVGIFCQALLPGTFRRARQRRRAAPIRRERRASVALQKKERERIGKGGGKEGKRRGVGKKERKEGAGRTTRALSGRGAAGRRRLGSDPSRAVRGAAGGAANQGRRAGDHRCPRPARRGGGGPPVASPGGPDRDLRRGVSGPSATADPPVPNHPRDPGQHPFQRNLAFIPAGSVGSPRRHFCCSLRRSVLPQLGPADPSAPCA